MVVRPKCKSLLVHNACRLKNRCCFLHVAVKDFVPNDAVASARKRHNFVRQASVWQTDDSVRKVYPVFNDTGSLKALQSTKHHDVMQTVVKSLKELKSDYKLILRQLECRTSVRGGRRPTTNKTVG
eukprot:COSAG03_NODE_12757_length_532_cov_1.441109_1_plen_125_part_01